MKVIMGVEYMGVGPVCGKRQKQDQPVDAPVMYYRLMLQIRAEEAVEEGLVGAAVEEGELLSEEESVEQHVGVMWLRPWPLRGAASCSVSNFGTGMVRCAAASSRNPAGRR